MSQHQPTKHTKISNQKANINAQMMEHHEPYNLDVQPEIKAQT